MELTGQHWILPTGLAVSLNTGGSSSCYILFLLLQSTYGIRFAKLESLEIQLVCEIGSAAKNGRCGEAQF